VKFKTSSLILSAVILVPACIILVLLISFVEFSTSSKSEKITGQSQQIFLTTEKLRAAALQNQSLSRGYIITGNEKRLQEIQKSATDINKYFLELQQYLIGKSNLRPFADSLNKYIEKRIAFSEKTITVAAQNGFEAAKKLVESGEGSFYTDKIHELADGIQHVENLQLNERKKAIEKSASSVNIILAVILLTLLFLLALSFKYSKDKSVAEKNEAAKRLFESDEKYRSIVEAVPEGIWLLDKNDNTVFTNSRFTQILGYNQEKAASISPFDFIINTSRRQSAEENVKAGIKERFESAYIGDNENAIWISVEINPIIKDAAYEGCLVITSDISKRKRAEMIMNAESRVMSKIALNEPLHKILDTIVLNIEASVERSICSILLLDDDGKTLRHGAAPHLSAGYIKAIDGTLIGDGQGSCGTAAVIKEPVIVTDINTDPLWQNYKVIAQQYGLNACWSTPILSDDNEVLGTFAVYHKKIYAPSKKDFEAVERATNHAKIAIEKNKAATILKESEEKYRTLVEQASDAIFIAGTDGRFVTVNSSAVRLSQYTEDELLNKNFADFALPEDLAKNPLHFNELKDGKTEITERLMKRKDSSIIDIEVTAKQLHDGRLLVFVKDVSERKKNEQAIKNSEAKYRAFFENSMDGILIGSPDGSIYAANPAACTIYERTYEELCKGNRSDLVDTNDTDFKNFLDERRKFGRARREVMQRKKNGTMFPAEISSSIFTDAEGQLRTIIIVRDITQRINAKNEIIKEKNLSDSIINSLPGVFYMYNYNWKFIRWNKNFEYRTGYSAAEIEQMHPLDFFSPQDRVDITEQIKNVFVHGEAKTEIVVHTKSGETFPYFLSGKLVDYEGKPSLLGIGFDISERLKAQEEIKQSNEQLRLLTTHLQQVREDERLRIAREIHDDLGQLVTAIKMDAAWIEKNAEAESVAVRKKIENIILMLNNCSTSIRTILQELRMGILDDNGLVEALHWLGRQFSNRTGVPVALTSNENTIKLDEAVAVCIFRVYQEALTNITKHAAAKNVTAVLLKEKNFVQLQVADDGCGFVEESIKTKICFGILGVKERVAALKGNFDLQTAPDKGTTVTVKLPV
jgi:PAS domain S-box-containing protein